MVNVKTVNALIDAYDLVLEIDKNHGDEQTSKTVSMLVSCINVELENIIDVVCIENPNEFSEIWDCIYQIMYLLDNIIVCDITQATITQISEFATEHITM